MKKIIELVDLISSQKIKNINIFPSPYSNTKINRLYRKIETGEIINETQILDQFYQGRKHQNKNVSRLKNKLYDRLINTLFFIDINHYSRTKYEIALHKIKRNTAAIGILMDRVKRNAAMELAEKTIKLAIKFDEVESVLYLSKRLRNHFTVFAYNSKKKNYYSKVLKESLNYYKQEIQAEDLYIELAQALLQNKNIDKFILKSQTYIQEIIQNQKTNSNYFFNYYAYNVLYFIILNNREYGKLLQLTNEAINFFETKKEFSKVAIYGFNFKKGYTLLNLGLMNEALETYDHCKSMGPTAGSISWFNIHAYTCMIAIIIQKYEYALENLSIATHHGAFEKLDRSFREPWLIKEAYLNFLIKMNKVDPSPYKLKSFKIGKFLNEVPTYSKDKRGYNIAIIIIQLLFFLLDRKFSKFIDRMDALNQYSYRYLRNDDTLRSNCFIKMMLKLPDTNFHPVAVQRHTRKLYKTLTGTKPDIREHSSNIEIIPYETLWEMVLELLEKQK